MRKTLKELADVEGLGKIVETRNDFYSELLELKEAGARPISPRDEAYARIKTRGREDIGRFYGTRTSTGFEYAKNQLPILRFDSRLNNPELARLAVEANRRGEYFCTDSTREYEESLKQAEQDGNKEPKDRNVIILPSRTNFAISDKENWEIYEAIFKDIARNYFELNGPISIYPVRISYMDSQNGTLLTQLGFSYLGDRSELDGYGFRYLYHDYGLRGVKEEK